MLNHDLPAGIPEWLAHVCGGELTRLERHTARREAWLVDVTGSTGGSVEGFLRLERAPNAENPWSLRHETRVVEALRDTRTCPCRGCLHTMMCSRAHCSNACEAGPTCKMRLRINSVPS